MATIPIEIINHNREFSNEIADCIEIANSLQKSIHYSLVEKGHFNHLQTPQSYDLNTNVLFDDIEEARENIGGFHPYLLLASDNPLYNEYSNLFGSSRSNKGLAAFTTNNVVESIMPRERISAYFLYYFAKYALSFLKPEHKNHSETKGCIYDRKISKRDILLSMKADAICESCRIQLLERNSKITPAILTSINLMLGESGKILNDLKVEENNRERTQVFISYAHKDEKWKQQLYLHLKPIERISQIEIWSDDKIKPGQKWFDEIKSAITRSKIGILLISPDFLASDFINHHEIPQLLENLEKEGGVIFPIIIRHSLFTRIKELSMFQASNSPSSPIAGLNESDQDKVFVTIAENIWDVISK